jgi:hypothetical protein
VQQESGHSPKQLVTLLKYLAYLLLQIGICGGQQVFAQDSPPHFSGFDPEAVKPKPQH